MNTTISCPAATSGSDEHTELSMTRKFSFFVLAILGFSFWFFVAVPFATHRESYSWLAGVYSQPVAQSLSFISVTYRPFAQLTTWLAFCALKPSVFPTDVVRQALLQGTIYALFVGAWWFIYYAALQWRLFGVIACVTGCVFFSGYVHLFHIYGLMYVPVMFTLGILLYHDARGMRASQERWLTAAAILLVLWHPFATALFLGYYFGVYVNTFRSRSTAEHLRALLILAGCALAIYAMVVVFARSDVRVTLHERVVGFVESYRTNEVNWIAVIVSYALSVLVVNSMKLSARIKLISILLMSGLGMMFVLKGLPLPILWMVVALVKLAWMRHWSLFYLMLAAVLLPFGGIIGAPVFALFGIILASYVTSLDWSRGEKALSFIRLPHVAATLAVAAILILTIRAGVNVPVVTKLARPLLMERERTYQMEEVLAWLHTSEYCGDEITFAQDSGSPVDSDDNVMTRQGRPPAALGDVRLFWDTVLRCQNRRYPERTATITFGGFEIPDARSVFQVRSRYAGNATVWVDDLTGSSAFARDPSADARRDRFSRLGEKPAGRDIQ